MKDSFYKHLASHAALALCVSAAASAQMGRVSGRIDLFGPARSLTSAQVTLRYVNSVNGSSQEAQRIQPAANGSFQFGAVMPGVYVLQVDGAGILSAQWGALGPELAGRALVVHTGENLQGLRIPVTSRPILCGRVFGLDGKPLREASVHAWTTDLDGKEMGMGGAGPDGVSEGGNATADAEGRYRFDRIKPGLYIVGANLPDLPNKEPNRTPVDGFWKDAGDSRHALVINLSATGALDTCPYDIHLKEPPKPYDGPRYRVEGSLSAASKPPTDRKLVWQLTSLDRGPRDFTGGLPELPFDLASPVFRYANGPPGRYRLRLAGSSMINFSGPCFPLTPTYASQELTVRGDLLNLQVELQPSVVVQGRVEEIMSPVARPSSRSPSGRYYIGLTEKWNCTATNAAPNGTFSFSNLDPGDYTIKASLPIYGLYTSRVELNGEEATDGLIHLQPGINTVRIFKRLDYGTVEGTIRAQTTDGAPALDALNSWFGGDEQVVILDQQRRHVNSQVSSTHGKFKVALPPGHYTVIAGTNDYLRWAWAWAERQWNDGTFLAQLATLGTPIDVKPNDFEKVTIPDNTIALQDAMATAEFPLLNR